MHLHHSQRIQKQQLEGVKNISFDLTASKLVDGLFGDRLSFAFILENAWYRHQVQKNQGGMAPLPSAYTHDACRAGNFKACVNINKLSINN